MTVQWEVGQTVDVQSRTWAGINKPGGCAKITKVHFTLDGLNVESIDVKYVLGGGYEKEIDPVLVSPFETLERGGRKRRGRDFLMNHEVVNKVKQAMRTKKKQKAASATPKVTADLSTSPSTPVTPEHPAVVKAKKKKVASAKPKEDKPAVPSYIIADRAVEVSPLPVDRSVAEPKKPITVARRGLFGCKGPSSAKSAATKPAYAIPARKQDDSEASSDASSSADGGPPRFRHKTINDVSRAHAEAVKESMTQQRFSSKTPLADRKVAPVAVTQSTSNTTSLKNVFDYELRKAKEFLDEVCKAPSQPDKIEVLNSKENRLNTSGSEDGGDEEKEDSKPAASNRRQEFLDLFRTFRPRFDDEDGIMEEAAFRTLVEGKASKPFSTKEIDDHLEFLYDDGKLMKSDGILYIID